MNDKEFLNFKNQILKGKDFSKKGEVDHEIRNLIELINSQKSYVTLSSCSGRTIVISQYGEGQKKNCKWVYITHSKVDVEEFICKCKENIEESLIVKFEPFILHVGCQTLGDAKQLLNCALNCGYRNSGLVPGGNGRITLAVRSTLNMEVPISEAGNLFASPEYLKFLVKQADDKMGKNIIQIRKFETFLSNLFTIS